MPDRRQVDERRDLPMQCRELALTPGSWKADERTVEVVFSTGARRRMYDWARDRIVEEELSLDAGAVRLERLNAGAPVLDTHARFELSNQIGVVMPGSARIEKGLAMATIRLSARDDVAPIAKDIADGIVRNISVGYMVHEFAVTEREGEAPLYRAVDWEPTEISFVPVPADAGAQVRAAGAGGFPCRIRRDAAADEKEALMADDVTNGADPTAPEEEVRAATAVPDPAPAVATGLVSASLLLQRARAARLSAEQVAELQDMHAAAPMDEARMNAELVRLWSAQGSQSTQRPARVLVDERDKVRAAIGEALEHRAGLRRELVLGGEAFRGLSLIEIGRELLVRGGEQARGWYPNQIAGALLSRASMTTSDFPAIMAKIAGKTLRDAYAEAPKTFEPFVRRVQVNDFKTVSRAQLSAAPNLLQVTEGGEIQHGALSDAAEQYRLATYGRVVALTRQMLVNDDLAAFTRLPRLFGGRAAALEADLVYSRLTASYAMADTHQLFDDTYHKNYTSSGTAISVTSLATGRGKMMAQKGLAGEVIGLVPRFLIVGPDKEIEALQYTANILATAPGSVNPLSGKFQVIVDARISGNQWLLAAEPSQIDTIELVSLAGESGPRVTEFSEATVDGIQLRVLFDTEAAVIDWRSFYKNAGA